MVWPRKSPSSRIRTGTTDAVLGGRDSRTRPVDHERHPLGYLARLLDGLLGAVAGDRAYAASAPVARRGSRKVGATTRSDRSIRSGVEYSSSTSSRCSPARREAYQIQRRKSRLRGAVIGG